MIEPLIISNSTDLLRIMPSDILCIKAEGNYSVVITSDGEKLLVSFQLGQVEQMIAEQLSTEAQAFIRIGRGVIINRNYIFTISIPHQRLGMRSAQGHSVQLEASKESLKQLKHFVEQYTAERREK
ncbi:MAG: LytTR family transcriptional regulator [Prevotellaceae bacterium]|nr:LytTR family transcriptional regulator [Candidatus Minthosoma caballi]